MTLHQAAARTKTNSPIARALARQAHDRAANDNNANAAANQVVIEEALRYFAKHGLGAAMEAREQAESAFFAGDNIEYNHWLGICRTLDRRLAHQTAQALEA